MQTASISSRISQEFKAHRVPYIAISVLALALITMSVLHLKGVNPFANMTPAISGLLMGAGGISILTTILCLLNCRRNNSVTGENVKVFDYMEVIPEVVLDPYLKNMIPNSWVYYTPKDSSEKRIMVRINSEAPAWCNISNPQYSTVPQRTDVTQYVLKNGLLVPKPEAQPSES